MTKRFLKKIIDEYSSFPESELRSLVKEELEESDLLLSILENEETGHLVLSRDGKVVFYNSAVLSLLPRKVTLGLEQGASIDEALSDGDITSFIHEVISGKEMDGKRDFSFDKGGEVITLRFALRPITSEDVAYLDVVISDITERLRKETRLRRSESLASMTTMAAGIAHEIKNPLAAMKIHIQLMQKALSKKGSITEKEASRYLDVIDSETDRLNSIAVDFLYAVKPMNTELRLENINNIVRDIASFLKPEADKEKIKVNLELSRFLPSLEVDHKYVRQAILNLVQNAFYAMKGGGKLTMKTVQEQNCVALYIIDSGVGIEKENLSRIFEPYYSTKNTGTGLGLTTVYKIMKEHNGEIHVKSKVGEGTVFKLEFPVPKSQRVSIEEK